MTLVIDSESIKQLQKRFWILALLLLLPATAVGVEINFATMLTSLKRNAGPLIRFVVATAYVIGIWFVISAIMDLKMVGQSTHMQNSQQGHVSRPLIKMIIGVVMLYLPTTIDVGVWTLWGHTATGATGESYMSYTPHASDPFAPAKEGAIAIVRVVGYVSFVRGLIILSRANDQGAQPGTFGKGLMHVIGGILAINIVETVKIIANSLGFSVI